MDYAQELASCFDSEDKFISVLEQSWGVTENPTDLEFLAKVSATLFRLREALLLCMGDRADDVSF